MCRGLQELSAFAGFAWPGPLSPRVGIDDGHANAFGRPHRDRGGIEILETEHVDAEMIRRRALAVERVDAAARAEKMLRAVRIPFVGRQEILAALNGERTLVHRKRCVSHTLFGVS